MPDSFQTADLCDAHPDVARVADPLLLHFGGARTFHGEIATVQVYEDNVLMRRALEAPGEGRVLIVDGGGSTYCALMGDQVATLAKDNGWAGLIIHGCIRDSVEVAGIDVGVMALATCPRRSRKEGNGSVDLPVSFAGVQFEPGHFVYADADGLVVASERLT